MPAPHPLENPLHLPITRAPQPLPIWRLLPDAPCHWLAYELRDGETKQAALGWLQLSAPKPAVLTLTEPDAWYWGLAGVGQGHAFVHGYRTPTLPEPQGLYAFRLEAPALAWAAPQHTFEQLTADGVLVRAAGPLERAYSLLNATTGTMLEPSPTSPPVALPSALHSPQTAQPNTQAHALLTEQLQRYASHTPAGEVLILQTGGLSILSYHQPAGPELAIYKNGRRAYRAQLPATLSDYQPHLAPPLAFALMGSRLVYLPEKSDITIVDLTNILTP